MSDRMIQYLDTVARAGFLGQPAPVPFWEGNTGFSSRKPPGFWTGFVRARRGGHAAIGPADNETWQHFVLRQRGGPQRIIDISDY